VLGPVLAARGITADQSRARIEQAIQQGPGKFAELLAQSKLGAEKFMELNKPSVITSNLGKTTQSNAFYPVTGETKPVLTQQNTVSPDQQERTRMDERRLQQAERHFNVNKSIAAIAADPYNISGVQAAFPIPGAPAAGGTPSATDKHPSGAPVIQNPAAAMKAGLTGEDLLVHLPTSLANQVRAIGEGREPSPASRSLTTPAGRQLMSLVSAAYPNYDAKNYATMGAAEKAFTSGKKGDTTRSFNVAIDHLGTLQQVSDALHNNDVRLFNQAGNFIALQTGQPAPADFAAVKRIVADEVTKAVLGSAGALGDRKAVDDAINAANSPAQLRQVINRYKELMGGQLSGLEQQYTSSTGKADFRDRFLTPTTKAALGTGAPAKPAAAPAPAKPGGKPSLDSIFGS
jgi:hypothetical protein